MAIFTLPFLVHEESFRLFPGDIGYYRILVDNKVKYLRYKETAPRAEGGAIPYSDFGADLRGQHLAFSGVPPGDWTIADLTWINRSCKYELGTLRNERLAALEPLQECSTRIDESELPSVVFPDTGEDFPQCQGLARAHVRQACVGSEGPVVINYEYRPDDVFEAKAISKTTSALHGLGICPRILALVTENHQRIIGYVAEFMPEARVPTKDDYDACRILLERIHSLGWVVGATTNINKFFTIDVSNNRAYFTKPVVAHRNADPDVLQLELKGLRTALGVET